MLMLLVVVLRIMVREEMRCPLLLLLLLLLLLAMIMDRIVVCVEVGHGRPCKRDCGAATCLHIYSLNLNTPFTVHKLT